MAREFAVSLRARAEIREALEWWLKNRPKAPRALVEDLKAAFRLIREHPRAGLRGSRSPERYRLNLRRARYAVYYEVVGGAVRVLSLWHASRGRTPDFDR